MYLADWIKVILTAVTAFLASSGFWAWLLHKRSNKDATTRLLMGLAYDKITTLGMRHVERGEITTDEYEDFRRYLYDPYKELSGNGTADRVMNAVSQLPITNHNNHTKGTPHEQR